MSTALQDTDAGGAFVRKASVFRHTIEAGGAFPPVAGRYILYVSYACPWANRCLAVRCIKGLEGAIEVVVVSPVWRRTRPDSESDTHEGWVFDPSYDSACGADPLFGARSIRDVYEAAMKREGITAETRFTVPLLVDRSSLAIVNNESSEIIRMLDTQFNALAERPDICLCPAEMKDEIARVSDSIYDAINNGVYRCGFAQSQGAYDAAAAQLFRRLGEIDELLRERRFLLGSRLTEADLRLFMTLVRFDEVYVVHFKCAAKAIREYEHLPKYLRDVYHSAGLAAVVNMRHIRDHYFRSHGALNPYRIVPVSEGTMDRMALPHGRQSLGDGAPGIFYAAAAP